jgi:hypothetical protein
MRSFSILVVAALAACSDQPFDPGTPAIDPTAPRVHITSPAWGTFAGDHATVEVRGTASDDTAVASVEVNGVRAAIQADGSWSAVVPVSPGTALLHAVARDAQGNVGKESRAVAVGPTRPLASAVPDAITASLSAQTFAAIGQGAAGYLKTGDLQALVEPKNPIVNVNPDSTCNFARASITHLAVGPATTVAITPRAGGLALAVELDHVAVKAHLSYALLCVSGGRDVTISASRITVAGNLSAGIARGAFDVKLADQRVTVTGFDVDLGGVPGDIVDLLHLDTALGPVIGFVAEKLIVPMLSSALAGLVNQAHTLDVLGTPVDVAVAPARLAFAADGAILSLDTTLRAHGDAGGYVYVANAAPAMSTERGFQLAVADDAVNQLLGSYWAARGLDRGLDLTTGDYGQIGQLYDRVELSAKVPPFVDASGDRLVLTVGDLIATFKRGDQVATQVAISAEVELAVVVDASGAPRLDVGMPTTYVDVLDENVDGANALSNAQFEAITSFALARIIAFGSGAVGAIPLPSVGGVALHDLGVAPRTGYLVVDGEVQ